MHEAGSGTAAAAKRGVMVKSAVAELNASCRGNAAGSPASAKGVIPVMLKLDTPPPGPTRPGLRRPDPYAAQPVFVLRDGKLVNIWPLTARGRLAQETPCKQLVLLV